MKKNLLYIFLIVIILAGVEIWYTNNKEDNNPPSPPPPPPVEDSIKVLSPNGGETWSNGQKVQISWSATEGIRSVNIRLAISGSGDAQNFNAALASGVPNTGSYEWTVQELYAEVWGKNDLPASDKYVITVEDGERNNIYDTSDVTFSIKLECAGGILYGKCSPDKPLYCENGNLIKNCASCGCPTGKKCNSGGNCATELYKIPVLNLSYIPTIADGQVDITQTGDWQNPDVLALRDRLANLTEQLVISLEKGSIYHGYKDSSASPSLDYSIFENKEFLTPVPALNLSNTPADHKKILTDLNICDYVNNKGVKEVWVWMYHTKTMYPVESYFTGPLASFGNGYMDIPKCAKGYTVYDYNSGRSVSMAVENHTHHIESVFDYIDGRDSTPTGSWGKLLFWGKFVGSDISHAIIKPGCGWTHYPPNGQTGYDWKNQREVLSDCEDWKPDGTGTKKLISCHTWSTGSADCADDEGLLFKIWWMQNIPGKENDLSYNGKKLKNWWDFIGDFDAALRGGKNLTY